MDLQVQGFGFRTWSAMNTRFRSLRTGTGLLDLFPLRRA